MILFKIFYPCNTSRYYLYLYKYKYKHKHKLIFITISLAIMFIENIIIGAGPAGLQLGYFFEKHNIDYIILEKSNTCGSFFDKYPHSGQLISVNKKYTGSDNFDFNLRHDWNSLLNDDNILFTKFDDDYYPSNEHLVNYLNHFKQHYNLKVNYNCNVKLITKTDEGHYNILLEDGTNYKCTKLITATGLSLPNYPNIKTEVVNQIPHYHSFEKKYFKQKENLEHFKNKKILIVGQGNSAMELANLLNEVSSSILIYARRINQWASSSHYAGHIRSKYLPFLDTFLLKSLNGINYFSDNTISIIQHENNGKYIINECVDGMTIKHTREYDKVIFCTGWKFNKDIFDFNIDTVRNNKYPNLTFNSESTNNPNLYFIGSLMHPLDGFKSSGGFIHGFRYLIKNFFALNYNSDLFVKKIFHLDDELNTINVLSKYVFNRLNTTSSLYQMYGVLCDFFVYNSAEKQFLYMHDLTHTNIKNIAFPEKRFNYFTISLEYGKKPVTDIYQLGLKVSNMGEECNSTLLHPVLRIYNEQHYIIDIYHFDENLFAEFTDPYFYHNKLNSLIKGYYLR